ncbi:hypothetical protein ON010_g9412 [Phytophthora cinnamomi]|nr:hypothetical protein ON010_g9412 [Phytophthora cinnamomi]
MTAIPAPTTLVSTPSPRCAAGEQHSTAAQNTTTRAEPTNTGGCLLGREHERAHVVARLLVVLHVGAVAERELLGLPAAADRALALLLDHVLHVGHRHEVHDLLLLQLHLAVHAAGLGAALAGEERQPQHEDGDEQRRQVQPLVLLELQEAREGARQRQPLEISANRIKTVTKQVEAIAVTAAALLPLGDLGVFGRALLSGGGGRRRGAVGRRNGRRLGLLRDGLAQQLLLGELQRPVVVVQTEAHALLLVHLGSVEGHVRAGVHAHLHLHGLGVLHAITEHKLEVASRTALLAKDEREEATHAKAHEEVP